MQNLKYSEIIQENKKLEKKLKGREYPIGILTNITLNQLKEVFEFTCRNEGINASCSIGNYDNIVQDSSFFKD